MNNLFAWSFEDGGIVVRLEEVRKKLFGGEKRTVIPPTEWGQGSAANSLSALARLESLSETGEEVRKTQDGFWLSHGSVAALTEAQAKAIGLPGNVQLELRLDIRGSLEDPKTRVELGWYKRSGQRAFVDDYHSILDYAGNRYRVPDPQYALIGAVDRFNEWDGNSIDERLLRLSELKLRLEDCTGVPVDTDKQLGTMRLLHASCVSLDIQIAKEGIDVQPVLFSKQYIDEATAAGEPIQEASQLLTDNERSAFIQQFGRQQQAKPTYVLGQNQYVFIDPSLRKTVEVIKDIQAAPAEVRARFAKSPQSFLKRALEESGIDDEAADEIVESSFVESDRFSERVLEVGLWEPPVLPFIQRTPNQWFPEGLGLKIGSEVHYIPDSDLRKVAEAVQTAISEGKESIPLGDKRLPANDKVLTGLNALLKATNREVIEPESAPEGPSEPNEPQDPLIPSSDKTILKVRDNLVSDEFTIGFDPRCSLSEFEHPRGLRNSPKTHQIEGIHWLQLAWSEGYSGVLLADDMGLGKTFQTLAFISWLSEKRESLALPRRPVLILAPTSLLGNWEAEAQLHLEDEQALGIELLYGTHLKAHRLPGAVGNDVTAGRQTLRHDKLSRARWILTTYETMRDYHMSIASIQFSCIIYDEMQKIKNPTSMVTHAAQALNGEFSIGLTGTPIENSLADIWTLFDTLMPGSLGLGSLKAFLSKYTSDDPNALIELKSRLTGSHGGKPPVMLRRLKSDVAKDLPEKREVILDKVMPEDQANLYLDAVNVFKGAEGKGKALEALQRMRSVSLHPFSPDSDRAERADTYISDSARLAACFEILDKIHLKGEKALIFIENRAMHEWLAYAIMVRYDLPSLPARIFGAVDSKARSRIVKQFQDPKVTGEFDVLLLSPRAAGVGLTLTAASHVIHLSRWWNPAVEDQCTDRAYRIGQEKDVNVYLLRAYHPIFMEGSFDFILHDLLESKRSLSREMLIPMEDGNEMNVFAKKVAG